jgi:hypothetical protein
MSAVGRDLDITHEAIDRQVARGFTFGKLPRQV